MKKEKIGIYGGTFSPPHTGHVNAARCFIDFLALDRLMIIPDFLPPHKEFDGMATTFDRLNMCRLAFSNIKNAEISEIEIKRGGKSYTAHTLEELSTSDRELFFLCGTDMILTLGEWYMPKKIFELATICYIRREDEAEKGELIDRRIKEYKEAFSANIIEIPGAVVEVSSSRIRQMIKNGENLDGFLPSGVSAYITEKELYK